MKRKLTAVLLTLCMVLGMLPMSAFAYWTVNGTNVEPSDITNGTFTVDGTTYYVKGTVTEGDALVYYATADATTGTTVEWTAPAGKTTISEVALTVSASTAKVGDNVPTVSTTTTGVTADIAWADAEGAAVTGTFAAEGTYTGTITLTVDEAAYELAADYTVTGATKNEDGTITVTCVVTADAPAHEHTFTPVAEVAATCTTDGMKAHQTCSGTDCAGKFFDAEGNEVTEASLVIAALGHNKTHHEAVAATCTTDGTIEYWSCDRCSKNFSDEACTTEVTSLTVAALGHDYDPATGICKNDPTHTDPAFTKVEAEPDNGSLVVDESAIGTAEEIAATVEAAKAANSDTLSISVVSQAEVSEAKVTIPSAYVEAVADSTNSLANVAVTTSLGTVAIPAEAIKDVTDPVTLTVSTNEKAEITEATAADTLDDVTEDHIEVTDAAVAAVQTAPVISIDLKAGDKILADKDSGITSAIKIDIAVSVPDDYTNPWMVWVNHVAGKISGLKKIAQVVNGRVTAELEHLSDYVLLDVEEEPPVVDDTKLYTLDIPANADVTIVVDTKAVDGNKYYANTVITGKATVVDADKNELDKVLVNGEAIDVKADGTFSFTLTDNTELTATVKAKALKPITPDSSTEAGTKYTFEIADGNVLVYQTKDSSGKFVIAAVNGSATVSVEAGIELTNAYECELQGDVTSKDFDAFAFADGDHSEADIVTTFQIKKA